MMVKMYKQKLGLSRLLMYCGAQALEIIIRSRSREKPARRSCSEAVQGISCACRLVRSKYNIGAVDLLNLCGSFSFKREESELYFLQKLGGK